MSYDVVVLGSGPAGFELAIKLGKIGKSVCLIEKGELGGVCLNSGCIPTKTLVNASKKYAELKSFKRLGISIENQRFDYSAFKKFQNSVIFRLKKGIENSLAENNVEVVKGRGYVKSRNLVAVYDEDDQIIEEFDFKNLVVSTGSHPVVPLDWQRSSKLVDPQKIWQLEELPKDISIIGGGVIGVEYASMFVDIGINVSIYEKMDSLLATEEPEISKAILDNLKARGVKVFLTTEVDLNDIESDLIVCAVGRVRDFKSLGLENANIYLTEKWLRQVSIGRPIMKYDTPLQVAENIFIAGDIAPGIQLAHKANFDAEKIFEILQGKKVAVDYSKSIPSAIFTSPEISRAGFTKEYAENYSGTEIKQMKINFAEIGKAVAENYVKGFMLLNYMPDNLKIVGVSIYGNNASEMNAAAQLIVQNEMTVLDVDNIVFSHPTVSEVFKIVSSRIKN